MKFIEGIVTDNNIYDKLYVRYITLTSFMNILYISFLPGE